MSLTCCDDVTQMITNDCFSAIRYLISNSIPLEDLDYFDVSPTTHPRNIYGTFDQVVNRVEMRCVPSTESAIADIILLPCQLLNHRSRKNLVLWSF